MLVLFLKSDSRPDSWHDPWKCQSTLLIHFFNYCCGVTYLITDMFFSFSFPGKGNYWAIHPNCLEDFKKGDFRRRQARRRARRNLKNTERLSNKSQTSPPNVSAYVPMTSSFAGYQPYPHVSGLMAQRFNQQTTQMLHNAPSVGQYYNHAARYPASQYMPMAGYNGTYDYTQGNPITMTTEGVAFTQQTSSDVKKQLEQPEMAKWYEAPEDWALKQEDIPSGNRIIIS